MTRRRSLAAMRLGRQVTCHGDRYSITLEPTDVKNGKRLEYDVRPHLVPTFAFGLAIKTENTSDAVHQ